GGNRFLWNRMQRFLVRAFARVNRNERRELRISFCEQQRSAEKGAKNSGGAMSGKREITRRKFVKDAAIAGAGLTIVPRHVLGKGMTPPSDLLNIAGVGIGGMGRANLINLASQNIVAVCVVDWAYADGGCSQL